MSCIGAILGWGEKEETKATAYGHPCLVRDQNRVKLLKQNRFSNGNKTKFKEKGSGSNEPIDLTSVNSNSSPSSTFGMVVFPCATTR